MPEFSDDPIEREGEEQCVSDIAVHGTHVLNVYGGDDWPDFAYTVGLMENFGHPELIILGIPGDRAHLILNCARDVVRNGARFSAGSTSDDVLEGFSVTFRAVPPAQRSAHFGWAEWFYDERPYSALQLVYPDQAGRWPWDPESSNAFRESQPILADIEPPNWVRRAPG